MIRAVALLLLLLGIAAPSAAAGAPAVYYLMVGSSRYLAPANAGDHGFQQLAGARNGANALSDRLSAGGARFGIALSSPEGTIVGRRDIYRALNDLLARVASDRAAQATVIVYLAAHGISDGFGWNHFSVPGDLTYRGDPDRLPTDQLADQAIYAAAIVDRLNKAHVHYVLLLDTCYEGRPSRFDSPVLTPTASQNIEAIAQALRFANEFHQADPVLFSTAPGTIVPVAPDPTDPKNNSMGPLARRLVLLIDQATAARRAISVADLVRALRSNSVDPLTRPAVTYATPGSWWGSIVIQPSAQAGFVDERAGSAVSARLCCTVQQAAKPDGARAVTGTITLRGALGELVTGGRTIILRNGLTLERPDAHSIILRAPDPGGDWEVRFTVPGVFRVATYERAERAEFTSDGHAGLAVSGLGHSCNSVRGRFDAERVPTTQTGALALRFTHYCDDVAVPLTGEVSVSIK